MRDTLLKAIVALAPLSMLFVGAAALYAKARTVCSLLQLLGAGCLGMVVLIHVAEGLGLWPGMGWGRATSPGHYLDLGCAALGLTLFPLGYLLHALQSGSHRVKRS